MFRILASPLSGSCTSYILTKHAVVDGQEGSRQQKKQRYRPFFSVHGVDNTMNIIVHNYSEVSTDPVGCPTSQVSYQGNGTFYHSTRSRSNLS